MHRILIPALLLLAASPSFADEQQRVTAAELIAAAQAALEARSADAHLSVQFASIGHINDVSLSVAGTFDLRPSIQDSWLRPRIGVPVDVYADGHKVASVTTWFSATAPIEARIYSKSYPRGASAADVRTQVGRVDLARTHGVSTSTIENVAERRLHHAVTAGDPVLPDDFEKVPDVQAQQSVHIEVASGVIRLTTDGRALTDGAIGQIIPVLPANASQPVHARVVSKQAVSLEN